MGEQPFISVISPVYQGEEFVDALVERIVQAVSQITPQFEILLVEDASPDRSWEKIVAACQRDKRVKGLRLSRNFGQQYALAAGLAQAQGEWVVTLDCDLQDQPEEILKLYAKAQEGYDFVLASRPERHDNFLKKLYSRLFYAVLSYLTDTPQDSTVANFALCHRRVVEAINSMGDYYRYFPTQVQWVGFRSAKVPVVHAERPGGESSYTFKKRMQIATDTLLSFSDKPLRLTVRMGVLVTFTTLGIALILVILYFMGDLRVRGWTSSFLSIWFLSGVIIAVLGMVGLYLGRIFETVKRRPPFIIAEKLNQD